ncbi:unnamed protein product [Closterium sp. NIES-65]|nr:unnamed protein product [Closterium sp. NIES-65]
MATPSLLAFDTEVRAIDFDVWVDDLQLFLQCDRADGLSLFDLTSGTSPALLLMLAPLGAPPPPFCPLLPLLLRPTFLVSSRSVRRLPLAGDAALAKARGAEALEERAGAVEVEVEAAGGVGMAVGVEVGEKVSVAAVEAEAAAAVAVGAEVAEVAAVEASAEAAVVAEAAGVAVELVPGLRRGVVLGDCYRCFPPDPGIETAALGAGVGAALGACEAAALGASASASSGTAAPSGTLSGLYLPSFSTNLVSGADLQDGGGRQQAAPHSSQFPPTEAPLQTLHMDVWGPSRVRRQGHEHYFLLVVDDYSRYTAVFPMHSKGDVTEVLIDWIRAARLQLRQSFGLDFPVLRLHLDRGGEFSSGLMRAYCRARGIRQTFTLPDSPQQNGIAERRIGMVMDVARTSMMHAAAPHFLWPFAVRYAAHRINLHSMVSRPETSPALLWTGKVGDVSAFWVWGSRAFVCDLSADKLSPRAAPCVFLGFPSDALGWQFYHPTSRRVLFSQDVTFDKSVPYYRLFPYRTPSLPPPPLFLLLSPPPVAPLPPQGPAPSGVS